MLQIVLHLDSAVKVENDFNFSQIIQSMSAGD